MELISRILKEYDYELVESGNGLSFFAKENEDYYIVARYDRSDIIDFNESEITKNAVGLISKYKNQYVDLSKNTSLLVCIEVDDYESFISQQRNEIYSIEEDPYVFRKYALLYTQSSVEQLLKMSTEEILTYVQNIGEFNIYEDMQTRYNNSGYFLALQLLIKIPFLELSKDSMELKDMSTRLEEVLAPGQNLIASEVVNGTLESLTSVEDDLVSLTNNTDLDAWLDRVGSDLQDVRS